jgi:hypothetical protein
VGDIATGPKKPRGKGCAEHDSTYQIGENLKTGAQEEKGVDWNSRQAEGWREFEG